MTGNEFLKKLKLLGTRNRIPVKIVRRRGKGSHQTVFFGSHFTILIDPKKELKSGTLFGMLQQHKEVRLRHPASWLRGAYLPVFEKLSCENAPQYPDV